MKLLPETIKYIQHVVDVATLVGIDEVIIEPNHIRAVDENRTVVINHTENVPTFEFGSIGLNRLSTFKSRLSIAASQKDFEVITKTRDDDSVMSLTFKGKGTKIDYLCGRPSTIKAPRAINETFISEFTLNSDALSMMLKGQSAMGGADVVSFSYEDGIIRLEIVDPINKDVFNYVMEGTELTMLDESVSSFTQKYPIKTLLAMGKEENNMRVQIGRKGLLKALVNKITLYVIPKV